MQLELQLGIPSQITPFSITDEISQFCNTISSECNACYVQISSVPEYVYGECYSNVDKHIIKNGGSVRYGWSISHIPSKLIEAEFHAVWVDSNEVFHCVTPRLDNEKQILFLPVKNKVFEGIPINSIRKVLNGSIFGKIITENAEMNYAVRVKYYKKSEIPLEEMIKIQREMYESVLFESKKSNHDIPQKFIDVSKLSLSIITIEEDSIQKPATDELYNRKIGNNEICPLCKSGKKFKKCCKYK